MTATTPLSVFHQWLLADPANRASACAIILHTDTTYPCEDLIQIIANHLNEYDDDGDGCWLPATPELVGKIAKDPNQRLLLGLAQNQNPPATGHPRTLAALGHRGHVVFRSPSSDVTASLSNTFHAGVGLPKDLPENCHLILNANLMDQKCIAHIIGDVFLEWLHCEMRQSSAIRDFQ